MNRLQIISIIVVIVLTGQGCASFIGMQTAEIVPEGTVQFTQGGVETLSLPQVELNDYDEGNQWTPFVMIRKGMSPKSEMQSWITPNSLNFNFKHSFGSSNKWLWAYGIGSGYTFLASSFDDQIHIVDFPLTLYSTCKLSDGFSVSFSPKLIPRMISESFSMIGGSSLTLGIGKKIVVLPEVSFFYDVQQNNMFLTGGIGFAF